MLIRCTEKGAYVYWGVMVLWEVWICYSWCWKKKLDSFMLPTILLNHYILSQHVICKLEEQSPWYDILPLHGQYLWRVCFYFIISFSWYFNVRLINRAKVWQCSGTAKYARVECVIRSVLSYQEKKNCLVSWLSQVFRSVLPTFTGTSKSSVGACWVQHAEMSNRGHHLICHDVTCNLSWLRHHSNESLLFLTWI